MIMVKDRVIESLKTELEVTEGEKFNEQLLISKVNNAYAEVKMTRNYPSTYSESAIDDDMEKFYTSIRSIAMYDYNQIVAEGQTSYSSDGTSIRYLNRDKLFHDVIPIGGVL